MVAATDTNRIVITGVGVVSPIGIGNDAFWDSLSHGRCGIDYLKSIPTANLPTKLAAEIHDFDPLKYMHKRVLKVMPRATQLGVGAASLAMSDSALQAGDFDPERLGVSFGAGRTSTTPQELMSAVASASSEDSEFDLTRWGEDSMGDICPLWLLRQLPNMPACHVSINHDARGPNNTITSRDSSALLALSEAVNILERDAADCMIVGACGSSIHPVDLAKLALFENLSHCDDPQSAYRPFDMYRDGTIVGEGSAAFIVERYSHAVKRGAPIYAEVLGTGAGCDGRGYANGVNGVGLARAIQSTLRNSHIRADEIGHINAHGKSTTRDDMVESRAIHNALGTAADSIPVTALKSYFGHFDAGSGAVELAGSLLALQKGELPMTLNYRTPDPNCQLNVIHDDTQNLSNRTVLTLNRTMMGQSAAAILRAI